MMLIFCCFFLFPSRKPLMYILPLLWVCEKTIIIVLIATENLIISSFFWEIFFMEYLDTFKLWKVSYKFISYRSISVVSGFNPLPRIISFSISLFFRKVLQNWWFRSKLTHSSAPFRNFSNLYLKRQYQ